MVASAWHCAGAGQGEQCLHSLWACWSVLVSTCLQAALHAGLLVCIQAGLLSTMPAHMQSISISMYAGLHCNQGHRASIHT